MGAGALGSLFGGRLFEYGFDVVLVNNSWVEHVRTTNEEGLFIESDIRGDTRLNVPSTTDPNQAGEVDVLFIFVKSNATEDAIKNAGPMIHDETIVVTLQNGLNNAAILERYIPSGQILDGYTTLGASVREPGHVYHSGAGSNILGGDSRPTADTIAGMMNDADLETTVVDDPTPHVWSKQFESVGVKPVAALTETAIGGLIEDKETTWVMEHLVSEAVEVARAKGIEIIEDPIEKLHTICRSHPNTISSMHEDIQKERKTEIDHINGVIVDHARELDVEVPYNRMMVALVKTKERTYL